MKYALLYPINPSLLENSTSINERTNLASERLDPHHGHSALTLVTKYLQNTYIIQWSKNGWLCHST